MRRVVQGVRLALEPCGDVDEGFGGGNELAGENAGDFCGGGVEFDFQSVFQEAGEFGLAAGVAVEVGFQSGQPDVVVGWDQDCLHE